MLRALYSAATGMGAQQTNIDVIANNLANVNTTGFKKSQATFQDLLYQTIKEPGAATSQTTQNPTGIQVGTGVRTVSIQKIFSQGDFTATNNPLDVSIEGEGFFRVTLPDGTYGYTRAGSFRLDKDGQLVTPDGYTLDPTITVPSDAQSISISEDGTVSVVQPGSPTPSQLGQLTAISFTNPSGLKAIGKLLYQETDASGTPTSGIFSEEGKGRILQGFLESSNVSVVEEMVKMIIAQRGYESNSKIVQSGDDMIREAVNLKR